VGKLSNTHRIVWFDKQLRALLYPNRNTLAEKFEISVRQAQRDIDYMKNSLDAPIVYDARKRGYYYEDASYILPNVYINDLQKKMLKFLAYRYENYTQTPKVALMSELFKKLADEEGIDDEVPIFDLDKPAIQYYYIIYNAINSRNKLKLLYKDPYKGNIELKLAPVKLFYKYYTDYLTAYDYTGEKLMLSVLRLDRILSLEVLPDRFAVPEGFDERAFSSRVEREPYVARLSCEGGRQLEAGRGIRVKKSEGTTYEVEFYDIDEFINILLCNGCWDRILSPKWLKYKLAARCEEIIQKLGE